MKFTISGVVRIGKRQRKFKKEVEANSQSHAQDKLFALFGSTNNIKRNKVKIESVIGG